jgi:hypothetical protein
MALGPYTLAPGPSRGDDYPTLQGSINALPDMQALVFPDGVAYQLSAPLQIYNRDGIKLISFGGTDTKPLGQRGTEFIWKGTGTPAAAAFDFLYSRECLMKGLALSFDSPGVVPPLCGVRFDEVPVAGLAPTLITTANEMEDCLITAPNAVGTWPGVSLSAKSTTNVEYHRFKRVRVSSGNNTSQWGFGFQVGPSANAKGHLFEECAVSWATSGFYLQNGSAHILRCTGTDAVVIEGCDFEQSGSAVQVTNANGQLAIEKNRWGGIIGPYAFNIHGSGTSFKSNNVGCAPPKGAPTTQAFYPWGYESGFSASFTDGWWGNGCADNRYLAFRSWTLAGVETWRPF